MAKLKLLIDLLKEQESLHNDKSKICKRLRDVNRKIREQVSSENDKPKTF